MSDIQTQVLDHVRNAEGKQTPPLAEGKQTPLMQQFWDIKSAHDDKILLFRMGDFFEMFHRDAEIAAPILGIALTSRNKKSADDTPMCGVPHHSIAGPINKLLQAGFKVAICDQIEDPKFAKGLVKRAVTRVLSPGVVFDPETLEAAQSHYLGSMDDDCVSFLDVTTGEAFFYRLPDGEARQRLLETLHVVELVGSPQQVEAWKSVEADRRIFARMTLSSHVLLDESAVDSGLPTSARRLLAYAQYMQGETTLKVIPEFEARELLHRRDLGPTVTRHLEIFTNYRGEPIGSLFQSINRCKTSAGTRLLRRWLQFPLATASAIEARLDRVGRWMRDPLLLKDVRRALGGMGDVERRLGKIANPGCNPRDLLALADSLHAGLEARGMAVDEAWSAAAVDAADALIQRIRGTLVDDPPLQIKNGHFIRTGVDPALDELIELSTNSHQKIAELETRERESTGISSLKIRFNNVFGYYIEITHTHKEKVPTDRYQRKQTLANAERFVTKELEELEHKVLTAQGKRIELEQEIFARLRAEVLAACAPLMSLARQWSELDVVSSLAWLAIEQNYVRPSFVVDGVRGLSLKGSRHPVVEQALDAPFRANDIDIPDGHALLLTGPNMAGKSTLMRQVAITAVLAQAGSFVPAATARLPIFDRIFTRIGASDFLAEGLSTFMVEMRETAEMLKSATKNSLVILDEVGRGTSTFDGMSLAQAILEYLLETSGSLTLFATHYHELTRLAERFPRLLNAHMAIHEKSGDINFLHALVKGPANKSYGIQVARLAGLPTSVTRRAGSILKNLEEQKPLAQSAQLSLLEQMEVSLDKPSDEPSAKPSSIEEENEVKVLEQIRQLSVERMTPLEALQRLHEMQCQLKL